MPQEYIIEHHNFKFRVGDSEEKGGCTFIGGEWKDVTAQELFKNKRMSYMDAVIEYCSENGIDPSNTKGLINKTLKEKIAYEAQGLNMLKEKTAKLPI